MNYQKIYDALILRAKSRILEEYTEKHHILPRSLGGSDDATNIVSLTPEEHFLAHQLLVKIYQQQGNQGAYAKMLFALNLMSGKSNLKRRNKYYGWIRRKVSEYRTGSCHTTESKEKNSQSLKARYTKVTHHLKGKPLSEEHKEKLRQSLKGRTVSDETRQKISKANKGKSRSPEYCQKFQGKNNPAYKEIPPAVKEAVKEDYLVGLDQRIIMSKYDIGPGKVHEILTEYNINTSSRQCPHCAKIGDASNMLRWHFNNCKSKLP